jgi:hypothetical protein
MDVIYIYITRAVIPLGNMEMMNFKYSANFGRFNGKVTKVNLDSRENYT